jgi:hypothetical protein
VFPRKLEGIEVKTAWMLPPLFDRTCAKTEAVGGNFGHSHSKEGLAKISLHLSNPTMVQLLEVQSRKWNLGFTYVSYLELDKITEIWKTSRGGQ